jgi:6-phosphofructokinase
VHAPKTIDNDLMENDHVPGFISAAAFVANAHVSMDLDFRAMPGIYVAIVMGRHAGFLAAAAGWQQSPDDAPNLIYTPEKPFSVVQFLDEVDAVYARLGRCIVSMSEGMQDEAGRPLAEGAGERGGRARRPWQSAIDERRSRHRDSESAEIAFSQGKGACRYAGLSATRIYRRDRRNRPQGGVRRWRICRAKRLNR